MSDTGDMSPDDILDALPLLVTLKLISPDSYALGAQVCLEMKRLGVRQLIYTWEKAVKTFSKREGDFLVGPPKDDDITFISAMQDLHFRGGLFSAFDEARLYEPDVGARHVTLSPITHINRHYSRTTPIYFRITSLSRATFYGWIMQKIDREAAICHSSVGE